VLDRNLRQTHRTNPIYPAEYKGDNAVETYLKGTLLTELFALKTPFSIPDELRLSSALERGVTLLVIICRTHQKSNRSLQK